MNVRFPRFSGTGSIGRNIGLFFYPNHPEVTDKAKMDTYLKQTISHHADQFAPSTNVQLEYSFPGTFESGDSARDFFWLNLTLSAANGKKYRTSLERPLLHHINDVKDIKTMLESFLIGQINRIKHLEEIVSDETDGEHFFLSNRSF